MRLAHALICTLLLSLPFAAVAKKAKTPQPKQFIDRSAVIYPTTLPGYTFVERSYKPEQWSNGVGLNYRIDAHPGVRVDIFVYPLGRSPGAAAVDGSIAEVKAAIKAAEEQKYYSFVVIGTPGDFPLGLSGKAIAEPSPASDAAGVNAVKQAPVNENTSSKAASQSPERLDALAALIGNQTVPGKKLLIGFDANGAPRQSLAYVFYKQLFLFKIRMTADTAALSPVEFSDVGDAVARTIIPAIEVKNEGKCGEITIAVDDKKDDAAMADQLVSSVARVQAENCATGLGDYTLPPSTAEIEIVYPDKTWKAD